MARTHQEVREAAMEEAFAQARAAELENYTRHLIDRISRVIAFETGQFLVQETGFEPKVSKDFNKGHMRITAWVDRPRKIVAKISICMEVDA